MQQSDEHSLEKNFIITHFHEQNIANAFDPIVTLFEEHALPKFLFFIFVRSFARCVQY